VSEQVSLAIRSKQVVIMGAEGVCMSQVKREMMGNVLEVGMVNLKDSKDMAELCRG